MAIDNTQRQPADRSAPKIGNSGESVAPLWDADDVAGYLKLTRKGVYSMAERGVIPVLRIGGRLRFDAAEVLSWARQARRTPAGHVR